MKNKRNQIEHLIQEQGFENYKWINPQKIIVSQWVRVKCQFGCSDYGLGTCPPNTPTVEECKLFFQEYSNGLIIKLTKWADKDSYPSDWSHEITQKLLELERQIFLSGHPKTFLLNQTCCSLCVECPGTRLDCKDKKHSRPSPESFAVDVYQTVHNMGMGLEVVSDNPALMNRIAILLID